MSFSHPVKTEESPFKPDCLYGRVALITGGGSGICYEVGRQLLLHGLKGLIICGRRATFLKEASAQLSKIGGRCIYKTCDVRDPQQCADVVNYSIKEFGHLDILVNGAAGNFLSEASALKPKGFQTVMEIDTLGTFQMCHAAFPHLSKSQHGGNIINISATLQYGATWYQVHASAAKAAIDSMTRSMALEWGPAPSNIRVNGIAPGPIANTPGTTKLAPGVDGEEVAELVTEAIPLGRMGEASEIGMAAIYLCSNAGGYVTGTVLVVDGGEWLYRPPMIPREMVSELSRKVEGKSRAQAPPSSTIIPSKL